MQAGGVKSGRSRSGERSEANGRSVSEGIERMDRENPADLCFLGRLRG